MASAARFAAIAAVLLAIGSTGTASARSTGIGFTSVPQHAVQGDNAQIAVSVHPAGGLCTLSVRYQDGTLQQGLAPTRATGGRVAWTWQVPTTVQAGPAKATVHCARAGSRSRALVIVGKLIEPKITVSKQGFTIRPNQFGGGNRLSYGLVLHNAAPKDAMSITVQTNFVMGDDHLLGTDSQHVDGIAAGSDYALGNSVSFSGGAPIVRLEVVIQVGSYATPSIHFPTLANIHLLPQIFDPNWLGTVEGELQNTDPAMTLRSASLSAVVFDAAGNVIGGGTGYAFQPLPPGAREFLQMSSGFDVLTVQNAASVMVSMVPTWQQPGA
jgi:hypothetical protein